MSVTPAVAALPAFKTLDALVKSAAADQEAADDDALRHFNSLAAGAQPEVEDFLWDTYNAVFAVARQTSPEKQGPLVRFLQRLRDTTVTANDGQPLKLGNQVVWKHLPTFGWVARDLWNFDALDPSAPKAEKAGWDNLSALAAQLTARADLDNPQDPFDLSLYGLWALRTAFEQDHPAGADVAAAVRQASLWINYSRDALQKLSAKNRTFDAKSGDPGAKFADRGWKGFNDERWSAWADAFTSAQASLEDDEVKGLAAKAAESMKSN